MRLAAVVLAALALAPAAGAGTPAAAIQQGLKKAVAAGRIAPADAARYRGVLARTTAALPRLGGTRHANLQSVLGDVARQAGAYTAPRAETLFGMLDENVRYFGAQGPPAPQADVVGAAKVVYRYFPGHGLQFHPLANFASLNSLLAQGRFDSARELVAALQARAVPAGAALVWEYEWAYSGARPPWTSGMAQAVAAQAFARADLKLGDASLGDLAQRAYAALPGRLVMQLPVGPWVQLYSFSRQAVFNAQLQTSVSLRDYSTFTGDAEAGTLADALRAAAQKALSQVDTGYWTRYTLGGGEESRGYHDFVISLLGRLKAQTKDSFWSDLATRFAKYETQPPLFQAAEPAPPVTAAAKGTAAFRVSFWLSKASSVQVAAGGRTRRLWLTNGWHGLTLALPKARAGLFPVTVDASPIAGPRASLQLPPLLVLARAPAALGQLSLTLGRGGAGAPGGGLVVGVADNGVASADPAAATARVALATSLGLRAVRIAVPWTPGQTTVDPAVATGVQQAAAAGVRVFLEVYPATPTAAPADDAGRAAFAAYLQQLVRTLPQVKDVVVGSQVNNPAFWPASVPYLPLLAASYDALKAVDPTIRVVGGALNSQLAPGTWVLTLGQQYRRSGRTTPVLDALALQPSPATAAEPPDTVHASGPTTVADYTRLVANLKRAFDTTAQPGATLPIVYDGYAVQASVPPEKASLYTGAETDAVPEAAQGTSYARALQLAACQPTVEAFLFAGLVDDSDLARSQAGLYYPDGSPKSDLSAVRAAIAGAAAPSCPGVQPKPSPPTATFSADGGSVRLVCARDCVYVVALERARVPVRARTGAAAAGSVVTVAVPAGAQAGDRVVVHVASKADPEDAVTTSGTALAGAPAAGPVG